MRIKTQKFSQLLGRIPTGVIQVNETGRKYAIISPDGRTQIPIKKKLLQKLQSPTDKDGLTILRGGTPSSNNYLTNNMPTHPSYNPKQIRQSANI